MNSERMPALGAVMRAQFVLLLQIKYVLALLTVMVPALLAIHVFITKPIGPPWQVPPAMTWTYPGLVGIGAIAAAFAWFNESPRNRRYHWAMPVPRELHDVARIVAGAVWLMLAISVFCVVSWFAESQVAREQWLTQSARWYFRIFVAPLLAYALVTVPSLLSGKPLMWLGAAILVALVLSTKFAERHVPVLADMNSALVDEDYPPSLGAALAGGLITAPWRDGREVYRVYHATADEYFRRDPTPLRRQAADGEIAEMRSATMDMTRSQWHFSLAVWYAVALLGMAIALRRRPDV